MKKPILLSAMLVLTAIFAFTKIEITPIAIGSDIPMADVKMVNVLNDKDVSLNDQKGANGLLVIFSCNTCPFVVANEDRIRKIQRDAQKLGVGVAIINSNEGKRDLDDSKEAMRNYGNDQKFLAPYLMDNNSALADAFGATRTPECFLFDKNGKLVYHGAIDDSPKEPKRVKVHYLLDAMTSVSKGQEVAMKTSVSTGCSIKRKVTQ